jgi:Zn-dependent protease
LSQLSILLPQLAVLLLSLSFHEAAHAWTADRLGDSTARLLGRLTLNPLAHIDWFGTVLFPLLLVSVGAPVIGWAKPVPVDLRQLRSPRRDYALVAVAGPVSNLILAAGAATLFAVAPLAWHGAPGLQGTVVQGLLLAVLINVLLAVFNMIPVPPLDGGNVLMGIVPLEVARAIGWLRPYGFLLLYALMLSGVLARIMVPIEDVILRWLL